MRTAVPGNEPGIGRVTLSTIQPLRGVCLKATGEQEGILEDSPNLRGCPPNSTCGGDRVSIVIAGCRRSNSWQRPAFSSSTA